MTTTRTPNTQALDLRLITEIQPESHELIERLQADDVTAVDRARYLIQAEARFVDAVRAAVREVASVGAKTLENDVDDAVEVVVNALCTGHLEFELSEMLLRVYEREHGPVPDDAVGLDGLDGWVHLVEFVAGGLSLVRFPGTGEERRVGSAQLRPVPTRSDEVPTMTWWDGAPASERVEAVIEFDRTVDSFRRAVLAGDVEHINDMRELVDAMIGDERRPS